MVGNLNVRRPCIGPNEADPELIVDADAVLSRSITYQRFEAITRRRFQVLKHGRGLSIPFPGKRPETYNVLVNSRHADAARIERLAVMPYPLDARLLPRD
jgi:hypothetical protein